MRRRVGALLLLAGTLVTPGVAAATAEDIARRWPAGSIATVEQAQAARSAARTAEAAAAQVWREEQARCEQSFFVNRCIDRARRSHALAQQQARRVQTEAGDTLRRAEVEERRRQQAERERAAVADEQRARAAQERAAAAAQRQRELDDAARAAGRREAAAAQQARAAERNADVQRRAAERVSQEPQRQRNVEQFEERQRQARENAAQRAKERADNEQRRARRQAAREAEANKRAEARARAAVPPKD